MLPHMGAEFSPEDDFDPGLVIEHSRLGTGYMTPANTMLYLLETNGVNCALVEINWDGVNFIYMPIDEDLQTKLVESGFTFRASADMSDELNKNLCNIFIESTAQNLDAELRDLL